MVHVRQWIGLMALVAVAAGCAGGPALNVPGVGELRGNDEQKIGVMLASLHRNVENRRVFGVLAHVSRGYNDRENRHYEQVEELVRNFLREYRSIRITRTPPQVRIEGNRAKVLQPFGLTAEPADIITTSPVNLQGTAVFYLEKMNNEWRIIEYVAQ